MDEVQNDLSNEMEVEAENVPRPTSSMITVRLSDCQSIIDEQAEPSFASSPRNSNASLARSESDSSSQGSAPSGSPDSVLSPVDWEGLEKTEEQEPKDEGTDDVSSSMPYNSHCVLTNTVYRFAPRSPGEGKCSTGNRPKVQHDPAKKIEKRYTPSIDTAPQKASHWPAEAVTTLFASPCPGYD